MQYILTGYIATKAQGNEQVSLSDLLLVVKYLSVSL